MKRSELRRKTRMPRATKPIAPGASLKRNPPRKRDGVVSLFWRRDLGDCVVCPFEGGQCRGPVQGHHAVPQQVLRRRGLSSMLNDIRNRVPVCEHRHAQHTNAFRPIPREVLPPAVFAFADELGLGWYIERFYPVAVAVEAAA